MGDASEIATYKRVQSFGSSRNPIGSARDGRARWPVLEGAPYVRLHVALSGAGSHCRGCDRSGAGPDQHDARRLAEPLAETHAATRAAAIRRHHCHHGDHLGDGSLRRKNAPRAHFIGAARIYSTFSFGCFGFFFLAAE